jgi:hypothetical protein
VQPWVASTNYKSSSLGANSSDDSSYDYTAKGKEKLSNKQPWEKSAYEGEGDCYSF